jgi:hypothetical protein
MAIEVEGMDEVEAWKGAGILGPGTHPVIIETADETESTGGFPQVEIQFVSTEGLGEIKDWLTFPRDEPARSSALGRAKMLLDAVGIESRSGKWTFPVGDLPGKRLQVVVAKEESYKDPSKMVSKVKGFKALDAADVPADTSGFGGNDASGPLPF